VKIYRGISRQPRKFIVKNATECVEEIIGYLRSLLGVYDKCDLLDYVESEKLYELLYRSCY